MRSWIGATVAFASVVMTAHVRNHGASSGNSGSRHTSHRPAIASGAPERAWRYIGCFRPGAGIACHS